MNRAPKLQPFTQNLAIDHKFHMPEYDFQTTVLESVIKTYLPNLQQPFSFLLEDNAIKFTSVCESKGLILLNNLSLYLNDIFLGFIKKKIPIEPEHRASQTEQSLLFKDIINLEIVTSNNTVIKKLVRNKTACFDYVVVNGSSETSDLLQNVLRNERIKNAIFKHLFTTFGIKPTHFSSSAMDIIFEKNEDYYLNAFLHHDPYAAFYFKVEASTNSSDLYVCGFKNSIWSKINQRYGQKYIIKELTRISAFGDAEKKYFKSIGNVNRILEAFLISLQNDANKFCITEVLDRNPNLFAMSNSVFDQTADTPVIRKIVPYDCIETTTGWMYNKRESDKYMPNLKDYLKQLFPQEDERDYILGFLATLLNGERRGKHAIVLTDNTNGNNGKTKFVKFLSTFFGPYSIAYKKFLQKGTNVPSSSSHDAAGKFFKGKRIFICDELTNQTTIDNDVFKQVTGGEYQPEGRNIGLGSKYKFNWEAGVIFVFNQGCCPIFNFKDETVKERLVVFRMRSKFTAPLMERNENTIPIDNQLEKKFPLWMSSFFDILKSKFNKNFHLDNQIPTSCLRWRNELWERTKKGPIYDWLDKNIVLTEDANDMVQVREIIHNYQKETGGKELQMDLKTDIIKWLGIYYREVSSTKVNGLHGIVKKISFQNIDD